MEGTELFFLILSGDLVYYVAKLAPRIGNPDLIVCLDSGAGDYERLWMTTSLRGMLRKIIISS